MEERYREQLRQHESDPGGDHWEYAGLVDDGAELVVRVKGPKALALRWKGAVAYRVIDEAGRMRQHPLLDAAGAGLLYEVADSVYLEELSRLSQGALDGQKLTHYLVWTLNQCVDVVAAQAPGIE